MAKKVLSDAFATLSLTASVLRDHVTQIVKGRLDRQPIASIDRLVEFNQMRAAYVAQTSLYGYLKTRMGSKYVQLFQDDTFSASIDTAKWPVYASCLADLIVFSCAVVHRDGNLDRDAAAGLAVHCFRRAVERTFPPDIADSVGLPAAKALQARAHLTDWTDAAEGDNAFGHSPNALVAHAPVIEEFKTLDAEIVTNSMRFRWRDVRQQLRQRLDVPAVAADWRRLHG